MREIGDVHRPTVSVLLVEDEVLIRMMIAGMIEELGHVVVAEAGDIHPRWNWRKRLISNLPF
jgi:AmiR/NasT family two-component response regulator